MTTRHTTRRHPLPLPGKLRITNTLPLRAPPRPSAARRRHRPDHAPRHPPTTRTPRHRNQWHPRIRRPAAETPRPHTTDVRPARAHRLLATRPFLPRHPTRNAHHATTQSALRAHKPATRGPTVHLVRLSELRRRPRRPGMHPATPDGPPGHRSGTETRPKQPHRR
jgi:hypothetical protein